MVQVTEFKATIGAKFRIVIPKHVRDELSLRQGTKIALIVSQSDKQDLEVKTS